MKRSLSAALSVCVLCVLNACGGSANGGGGGGGAHAATHFRVTTPGSTLVAAPFNIGVVALDASDNVAASYSGTVHITSSDAQATLPANTKLTSGTASLSATLAKLRETRRSR